MLETHRFGWQPSKIWFTYFTIGPSIFAVIGFVGFGGGGVSIRIFYEHLDQMGLGLHFEPSEYLLNECVCICLAGEPVVFHGKNLNVRCNLQTAQPKSFIPAKVTGTMDLYSVFRDRVNRQLPVNYRF